MIILLTSLLILFQSSAVKINLIGDWGDYSETDPSVASEKQLRVSQVFNALPDDYLFTISLGDNFYPEGVTDEFDEKFKKLWREIYLDQKPWYITAGNHDHYGNITGQIEYSKRDSKWIYPNYYFDIHVPEADAVFILLDTEIIVNSTQQIPIEMKQDQLIWFEDKLKQVQKSSWIIVIGHYNIYSGEPRPKYDVKMKNEILPLLKQYNVNMYICGHNHISEFLYVDKIAYIVNGDGGRYQDEVYEPDSIPKAVFYNDQDFGSISQLEFIDKNRLEINYFMADQKRQVITTVIRNLRQPTA